MEFSVKSHEDGDRTVVSVSGELDLSTAPTLQGDLVALLQKGRNALVLDMSEVGFMDSTALGMLVTVHGMAKEAGGSLVLSGAQKQVRRVAEITGLEELFENGPELNGTQA